MRPQQRKVTPGVKAGRVRKKNRAELSNDYYVHTQPLPVVDRKRPGPGFKHLLTKQHIYDFIEILPDWDELSQGLDAVVLAAGRHDRYGWHVPGVVHVCAWEVGIWERVTIRSFEDDREIMERLHVPIESNDDEVILKFTESTARAFLLLDVFLHELGHHHDRITTRSKREAARGEPYAIAYAAEYGARIWRDYVRRFGVE
ncbi:MAG: hypothetical protein ACR2HJ_02865 [Fimbriimonadales bacterium]